MMSKLKKVTVLFRNRFNLSLQSMEVVKMSVLSHLSLVEGKEREFSSQLLHFIVNIYVALDQDLDCISYAT